MTARRIAISLMAMLLACSVIARNEYVGGNGSVCFYGHDADIDEIFGPTYSSPSLVGMELATKQEVRSTRIEDGIWTHTISDSEGCSAEIWDFAPIGNSCFVRQIKTSVPLAFNIHALRGNFAPSHEEGKIGSCFAIQLGSGITFYSGYASQTPYDVRIFTVGDMELMSDPEDATKLKLLAGVGGGAVCVICTHSVKESSDAMANALSTSFDKQRKRTSKFWSRWEKRSTARDVEGSSYVGYILKAQQDADGGILAGMVYHMAYVRDQYGDFRGLMALGHYEEARKILDFYNGIWKAHGVIHNAQAMGQDGVFHCHENDETEITGYLVLQAMDYLKATGDRNYLISILPMLEWAVEAQQRNIIDYMLPFNGDETYIAGGILPRKVMFNGSAEATLLFIEGSRRLLEFVSGNNLWSEDKIARLQKDVDECSAHYRENFMEGGLLYINNPDREKDVEYPETRAGVCLYPGHGAHCTTTYHYKGCLYFCADCMKKDLSGIEVPEPERFSIPSAYLFPIFIDAELFTSEEKSALLGQVLSYYKETGKISPLERILGYDYGMFLYALAKERNPLAGEIFRKMMGMRDEYGAWSEYYVNEALSGCPCRPWESGINIAAAIEYKKYEN